MPKRNRVVARARLPVLMASLVALSLTLAGCDRTGANHETTVVRVATGVAEQDAYGVGTALVAALSNALPHLSVRHIQTEGSSANVDLLERGQAELAIAGADTVYTAFSRSVAAAGAVREIRAVAVLYPSVLHVVVASGSSAHSLEDLRGRRVAVGSFRGGRTETLVRIVLAEAGVSFEQIEPSWLPRTEMAVSISRGTIDAACHFGGFALFDVAGTLRLLPVTAQTAGLVQGKYPFVRPAVLPSGTYPWQRAAVPSVEVDMLLVARRDLDDRLVYEAVRVLRDALPRLARTHHVLRAIELADMPTPPIPLHPGAVRFFREQALFR